MTTDRADATRPPAFGIPGSVAFAFGLAFALSSQSARAQLPSLPPPARPYDPYALPDAPAPPTLPDLTHRALALSLETTFASIQSNPRPDGSVPGRTAGWLRAPRGRVRARPAKMVRGRGLRSRGGRAP